MLRFAADENFNNNIIRALVRRRPVLDIVRAQDAGLSGADDPTILEWAARESRILLTHDASTITRYAYERVVGKRSMPGVFEVGANALFGAVVEDILLMDECAEPGEWEGQILYLPLP
ncbi:MAG: DUF5615 family PIN-like protein [Candidatus Hydrogenedentes bacterium]|nr:DUF5615 family PIN-like protein [Candidatus Hydrogenedentota bacterium]